MDLAMVIAGIAATAGGIICGLLGSGRYYRFLWNCPPNQARE